LFAFATLRGQLSIRGGVDGHTASSAGLDRRVKRIGW
jgi:hypothetical protein